MYIRYSPFIPINYIFLFCVVLLLVLSGWMEIYIFHESGLDITLFSLFVFWFIWFVHNIIQNKAMNITKIIMDTDQIIIITPKEKHIFDLDKVLIEDTWLRCIKILKVSKKFHISSAFVHVNDFLKLEEKIQKKININLNEKLKNLSLVLIVLAIMSTAYIFNVEFDHILYSTIGIYLIYQISKK